jgi:hypothetical protein
MSYATRAGNACSARIMFSVMSGKWAVSSRPKVQLVERPIRPFPLTAPALDFRAFGPLPGMERPARTRRQMQSQRMTLPAIVHTPQLWQAVAWRQSQEATPLQAAGRS